MQLDLEFFNANFIKYHEENPQIYEAFEGMTIKAIKKGFKNYGAKGIFELIRWHTSVKGNDTFKVNNIYTPFYARLFEQNHPNFTGFFRKRESKFDFIKQEAA